MFCPGDSEAELRAHEQARRGDARTSRSLRDQLRELSAARRSGQREGGGGLSLGATTGPGAATGPGSFTGPGAATGPGSWTGPEAYTGGSDELPATPGEETTETPQDDLYDTEEDEINNPGDSVPDEK